MLEALHVGVRCDGRRLLDDVSIQLRPRRFHALLGPNGAGKSTLLQILAGDREPDEGKACLDGIELSSWPLSALARRRAVLPQHDNLRFALRVDDVVRLGRLPWGEAPSEAQSRLVEQCLNSVGLESMANRAYPSLSGGERARAQLARVLAQLSGGEATSTAYLLLDEPTANLDLAHQHHCLRRLRQFVDQGGAVLAILHDPNQASCYADDVTLIKTGRIQCSGKAADVLTSDALSALYDTDLRVIDRGWIVPGGAIETANSRLK